jgi:serine/threonine protein kinase
MNFGHRGECLFVDFEDCRYFTSQQLTEKSDVYSFGVVLLEILCAREPISVNYEPDAYNLTAWVSKKPTTTLLPSPPI